MAMGGTTQVDIFGLDETISQLMKMEKADKHIIPVLENSYKRYQVSAFKKAPVLTGRLSSNLVDDRFTEKDYKDDSYTITQRQGTYSDGEHYGAYYLLYQEATNRSKSRFVRDSLKREEVMLPQGILNMVSKEMRMR